MEKPRSPTEITLFDLHRRLGEVLHEAESQQKRLLVTQEGKPVAVILGVTDFDDIMEELDPEFRQSLVKTRQEIEEGKGITLEDLRRDLEQKEARGGKRFR